jgi:hypothetical protein
MPHIERGSRMSGLMSYLQGEGRANEHTAPHLVAGNSAVVVVHGYDVLDRAAALAIAEDLDEPRRAFGTEITRTDKSVDAETEETITRRVDADVWHASLSIAAREGQLSDEKWAQIATQFVERMGFAGDELGKADCRWVAVRHGLSKNGNDHVHIAVSLVREDGTKASTHMDFPRAQTICRDLEREHGLEQLHDVTERSVARRGERPGERESAARRGAAEVDAKRLERTVRAAAGASQGEGEFVRRMRRDGVLIRPRFAAGRDDVVAGYSVALRPEKGQPVVWHGGGRLARDLTLPELRKGWPDHPERATEAAAEWRATSKNPWAYKPVSPGREESEMGPDLFQVYAEDMVRLHEYIAKVDPNDHATWAHVARDTSAAYAAWSRSLEPTPGPLADASRTLARSAQLRASQSTPRPPQMPSMANTTALILAQARKGKNAAAEALLLRQLSQMTVLIHDAAKASGNARLARETVAMMRQRLTVVRDGYAAQIDQNAIDELPPHLRFMRQRNELFYGKGPSASTKSPVVDVPATRRPATPQRDGHER